MKKHLINRALAVFLAALTVAAMLPVNIGADTYQTGAESICHTDYIPVGDELPTVSGHYYLTEDLVISETWFPADETTLCLNGHNIKAFMEDPVIVVNNERSFTLTDCQTSQGRVGHLDGDFDGVGIQITASSSFYMKGGIICENTTGIINHGSTNIMGGLVTGNSCGGVNNAGRVELNGGSITNNTNSTGNGGGINNSGELILVQGQITGNKGVKGGGIYNTGSVDIEFSHPIIINNNQAAGAVTCNLATTKAMTMIIAGSDMDSNIGITYYDEAGTSVSGIFLGSCDSKYAPLFFSDNSDYKVIVKGGGLAIGNDTFVCELYDEDEHETLGKYKTIDEAMGELEEAPAGTYTIRLFMDVKLKDTLLFDSDNIKHIHLDLNGSVLSGKTNPVVSIASNGNAVDENSTKNHLIVEDLSVEKSGAIVGGIDNNGYLTMISGTVSGEEYGVRFNAGKVVVGGDVIVDNIILGEGKKLTLSPSVYPLSEGAMVGLSSVSSSGLVDATFSYPESYKQYFKSESWEVLEKETDEHEKYIVLAKHIVVTFNLMGHGDAFHGTTYYGGKISKPEDPTDKGYVFNAWYKDNTLKDVYDFDTVLYEPKTLYARWKKIPVAADFTFTAPENLTYDGTTKEVSVVKKVQSIGNITSVDYYQGTSKLSGPPKDVGTYTVKINVAESEKYTSATGLTSDEWTFTIARKKVTVKAKDAEKTFAESDPSLTAEVSGLLGTDSVNYTVTRAAGEDAGTYTITPSGEKNQGNYKVSYTKGTFTIKQKSVSVTANKASKTFGDSDPTLTATVTGLVGTDTVVYTLARESGENAGTYTITPSGEASQGNYKVSYTKGTFTINQKNVSVTADAASKTFGDSDPALTATVTGLLGTDSVAYTLSRETGENAGTYTITPSGEKSQGNYKVSYTKGTFTINQKNVSVTANKASKTYGDSDPALTAKVKGLIGSDKVNYSVARDSGENVGSYTITPSGDASQGNYKVSYHNGTFTINQKNVSVTANDASKTYGDSDPNLTATVTGLLGSDVVNYFITRAAGENAGTYTITPSGDASQGNYKVSYTKGTFTIRQKNVSVTANNASKTYGDSDPTLTATVTGLVGSDVVNYSIARAAGEDAGTYTITPSGDASQGNYLVAYHTGVFTIGQSSALTVSGTSYSGAYDGVTHGVAATANIPTGTTIYYKVGDGKWTKKVPTIKDVGTKTVQVKAENKNYVTATTSYTLTVTPAQVSVKADDKERMYAEADPELTATVTGTIGTDTVSYTLARDAGEALGDYTITPSGDTSQGNYAVTYLTGKLTIIKSDKLTISISDVTVVYDGKAHTSLAEANVKKNTTIKYSADGKTWATTAPTITNVGKIKVYAFAENPNYETTQVKQCTVTVIKANQKPPKNLVAVDETISKKSDGRIEGVTDKMEYRKDGATVYTAVSGTVLTDLAFGKYYVRYKETDNYLASSDTAVTVNEGRKLEVKFDVAGIGTAPSTQKLSYKDKVKKPADPSASGYVFYGWFKDASYEEAWNFNSRVTADVTIYGKWKKIPTASDFTFKAPKTLVYNATSKEVSIAKNVETIGNITSIDYYSGTKKLSGAPKDVGTYTVKINVAESDKYTAAANITADSWTFNITRKPVSVVANNASKIYGEADPGFTARETGLLGSDKVEYNIGRPAGEDVGIYTILLSGEKNQGNYAVTFVNGTFTINPSSALTVTGKDYSGVYDGKEHGQAARANVTDGTTIQYKVGKGDWTKTVPTITDVGTMTVQVKAENKNYITATGSYELTVTPAEVTVKADDKSRMYAEADPEFTATVTGTIGTDTVKYTFAREAGENVGDYVITPSGDERQGNYTVKYLTGKLTIIKSDKMTISVSDITEVYNGKPHAAKAEASVKDNTTITFTTDGKNWATEAPSITDVGEIEVIARASNPNYETVTSRKFTVTVVKATRKPPENLKGVAETISKKSDGRIEGVDEEMEYRADGATEYTAVEGTSIEKLAFGKYFVRYKENKNYLASPDTEVTVEEGRKIEVVFDAGDGGVSPAAQYISYKEKAERPDPPYKRGYVFVDWYADEELTEQWDFNTRIKDDITLYGKWMTGTYEIENTGTDTIVDEFAVYEILCRYGADYFEDAKFVKIGFGVYKDTSNEADKALIMKKAGDRNVRLYEILLGFSKDDEEYENVGDDNDIPVAVIYPFDYTGTQDVQVLRVHDGVLDELGTEPNIDGEYVVYDKTWGTITVVACKYSTFAFVWSNANPGTGDRNNTLLWVIIAVAALALIAGGIIIIKKKRK